MARRKACKVTMAVGIGSVQNRRDEPMAGSLAYGMGEGGKTCMFLGGHGTKTLRLDVAEVLRFMAAALQGR
ncbi:hypothetical protein GOP47_0013137 [Adiantum capillus-veneris]|uniref:Uncharacterized protein n=1 Tax=Adiantum capillus-veneris TaxID=13818 RepID=A0A9D4ZFI0_ADICA|nr:hypothetical protein GOP47_0013137 [Adiantum capillus-veneris]